MRILIAGQPRSGTTALLRKIQVALPDHEAWYEPGPKQVAAFADKKKVIAKILLFPSWFDYVVAKDFNRQVLIVRDPRDTIISALLWWVAQSHWYQDQNRVSRFLKLLRIKEADPTSISFLSLIDTWSKFEGKSFLKMYAGQLKWSLVWHRQNSSCYLFNYNDLIKGRVDGLSDYLGVKLGSQTEEAQFMRWHRRTKGPENWRHWFTYDDVVFFHTFFAEFRDYYTMDNNWQLATEPEISSAEASSFVSLLLQKNDRWNTARGRLSPSQFPLPAVAVSSEVT